ncbi:TIGR03013 family XrtA/PEP-CTERM system glycosyltransferase [Lysobacter korlensis]|uniref:TIGR03013 family XrtA/PEP-CTERM system glycosyltransferase n=1 Tax=Lysobacter korlensis TaxID=553636 RepID=A0ABV6RQ54_9GAMM
MKSQVASRKVHLVRTLWVSEFVLLVIAAMLAASLRFLNDPDGYAVFYNNTPWRLLIPAVFITVAMAAFGLYQAHDRHNRIDFSLRLLLSFAFGTIGLLVLYYLVPPVYIGRMVLALLLAIGLGGIITLRWISHHFLRSDAFKRRVLVYGAGRNADLINSRLRRRADRQSFVVVGFVPVAGQEVCVPAHLRTNMTDSLSTLTRTLQIDEVVVAPDERRGGLPMDEMLDCAQHGISICDLSTFFEREAGMVTLSVADPSWLAFSGGFEQSIVRRLNKRFFDLLAAGSLLLMAWPAMLLVALAVKLESKGPVFYKQVRVGEKGRHFEVIKFRSMRVDAEKNGVAQWATKNDDRTTRVGRIIRATRLDELPQLFNVLRGDMSFVGPRPERPQFVEMLSKEVRYYNVRHCVKPGLTGWAQLRYPYGASVRDAEEKLTFDLFYIKNRGLIFDLMILLQTVEVVLFRRGAR